MPNVRGSVLQARLRYLAEQVEPKSRGALLRALDPATRDLLARPIDVRAWYPFQHFVDLNATMDRVLGRGDMELCYELGRYSAERFTETLHKAMLAKGSLPFLLEHAADLWSEHFDSGTLDVLTAENGTVTVRILGFDEPHRAHCRSFAGWVTRVVELAGARVDSQIERVCRSFGGPWCEFALEVRRPP